MNVSKRLGIMFILWLFALVWVSVLWARELGNLLHKKDISTWDIIMLVFHAAVVVICGILVMMLVRLRHIIRQPKSEEDADKTE